MNYLLTPYVAVLVLFVAELRGRLTAVRLRLPMASPWVLTALLTASYVAQLAILRTVALSTVRYHWLERYGPPMPIPVIYVDFPHADAWCISFLVLGAMQTAILVALYRTKIPRVLLWSGCAMNVAISIASPVLSSFDLYGYVQNAILGRAAYAPPNVPFAGVYHIFDLWWSKPTTTLYGPLWIPIVQLVTGPAPTLFTKMLAYRFFSGMLFFALLALLQAHGQPRRILAAVALNPAFAFLTVANGHNDLIAIVLIVSGAILLRLYPIAGVAMVVAAGLVKLPYVVLGLPILAGIREAKRRTIAAVAVVVVALSLSWLGGGEHYADALAGHAGKLDAAEAAHSVFIAMALVLLCIAIAGRRRFLTGVWFMPSFGSFRLPWTFPWYTLFAFPYALARRRVLRYLFVSMPFVTALMTPEMMRPWTFIFVIPAATVLSLRLQRGKPPGSA